MVKNPEKEWRYWLAIAAVAGMMAGLFISRALLSVSMMVFIANGLLNPGIKNFFNSWIKNKIAIVHLLIFLIPFISYLWSDDKQEWLNRTAVKLPLVFLPFGFFVLKGISEKHFKWLTHFFILLMIGGTIWSLGIYFKDAETYHALYLRAKVLPTPFDTNHIYFSFTVVVTLLLAVKLFIGRSQKDWRIIYAIVILWFIIYLHILSAKTGLLCLYFSLLVLGVYFLVKAKNKLLVAGLLLLIACLPFIAYKLSPTFKNRVGYVLYDYENYSRGNYIEGLSDGSRYRSLLAGKDIFFSYPLTGTGFGDVMKETNLWYDEFHPQIKDYERMLPSSELLLYACGAGIGGTILFLLILFIPFTYKSMQKDITWWVLLSIMLLFLLYEVSLEGQFGVFIYGFFTWWWLLPATKNKTV
jgi:O-antigen ligase